MRRDCGAADPTGHASRSTRRHFPVRWPRLIRQEARELLKRVTSIDDDDLARHMAREFGRQKQRDVGDLLWAAGPSERIFAINSEPSGAPASSGVSMTPGHTALQRMP